MFITDGDDEDLTHEEKAQKIMEQINSYEDPQPQQLQELARQARIKKEEEEYQKKKNMGYFEYFWDVMQSPFKMYDVVKNAKVIDFVEQKAQEGVNTALEKVADNPVVNSISGVFNFLSSIIQYWYLYLIGFVGLFIFIKKV
ncbi:hypothetical protein ABPG72_010355 [Tetrahymena utriculariae]